MDARTGIRPGQAAGYPEGGLLTSAESGEQPKPGSGGNGEPIALYLHIPFCLSKCPYCDFNTYEGIEPQMDGYVAALAQEIEALGATAGPPSRHVGLFRGRDPLLHSTRLD